MPTRSPIAPASAVERQMRRWGITLGALRRAETGEVLARLPQKVYPYVAISQQSGAPGDAVARHVAQHLGVECLDKELLEAVADRYHLPPHFVEFADEKTSDWLLDLFGRWLDKRIVTRDDYIRKLGQIVLIAAHHGSAVFVGRGVQHLLPRERGLAVRVIAPIAMRVELVARERNLDAADARAYVEDIDRGRREFIARLFHEDIADLTGYDLVLNVERLDPAHAGDAIVAAFRGRFGGETGHSPSE